MLGAFALATNRHKCQEVRHMMPHSLKGQVATATAAVIDLDPAATLARLLHDARVAAGYASQDSLARDLNVDRSVATKAESGNRFPSDKILLKWCELCDLDAGDILARVGKARNTTGVVPPWFESFREVQFVAYLVRVWHPILIPGPLQVPDYARALFLAMREEDDRVEDLVTARIDLQEQMFNRPKPVTLLAVMDEAVLRRRVGPPEVMRRQLLHLIDQGQLPNVSIQVVPADSEANAGCVGAFTIASVVGTADVLLSDAIEDVTTEQESTVRKAQAIFDLVRSDALSRTQSLELITKVVKECKL
jgi:transcriptional regulator with XRE-family HTH domain